MTYEDLGYSEKLDQYRREQGLESVEIGRIMLEHKERYVVKTPDSELDAELIGHLRFAAETRYDLPAVGDWVVFMRYDEDKALIQSIFPRQSLIERKAVAKAGHVQIIATNIDFGLIVQATDRDFNLNRMERYLTICHASKIEPIIVFSKTDLIDEAKLADIVRQTQQRIKEVPVITINNLPNGYQNLKEIIQSGKTYCLLGSSGVGKSTIINGLAGTDTMKTSEISSAVNKGKHTTSHRELIVLPAGGILIDNPGMREVGITDATGGLETTFETIMEYAENCRFNDCTHTGEKGCAVMEAVENGEIDESAYHNFLKMEREKTHFESSVQERRKKEKGMSKMIRNVLKHKNQNKYN
jgi:ribosome biogenesis GTPase